MPPSALERAGFEKNTMAEEEEVMNVSSLIRSRSLRVRALLALPALLGLSAFLALSTGCQDPVEPVPPALDEAPAPVPEPEPTPAPEPEPEPLDPIEPDEEPEEDVPADMPPPPPL